MWFAGYDSLYDSLRKDKPEVVLTMHPSRFSMDPWTRVLGDSLNRLMVREYEVDADPARDWNKRDREIRKSPFGTEEFLAPSGRVVRVAPFTSKDMITVRRQVRPEAIASGDLTPLQGIPRELAVRFKKCQSIRLRRLARDMNNLAVGVVVYPTEAPCLRITIAGNEIVFGAIGYFKATVIR